MSECPHQDWNPQQEALAGDQRAAYDRMREQCPVAFSDYFQWSIFRHQDVLRTLIDDHSFSNKVSNYISVPNGMDRPEHTPYRQAIEPYFSVEKIAEFKPLCQAIAADLVEQLPSVTDVMASLAASYAVRIQCAFMGWPQSLEGVLLDWLARNNQAVHQQDREQIKHLANEFKQIIYAQLDQRRDQLTDDLTSQLLQQQVNGKPLNDEEIASILRNWTVGEVGTIAASIGIIVQFLAENPELQQQLREQPEKLYYANDEILRLFNPLVDNRRRTACPVELSGVKIAAGQRFTVNWMAANRDPEVFEHADQFQWQRDPSKNLLYGAGVHVCPGADLARMELVVAIRALLQATRSFSLSADKASKLALYPMSGYASVPVQLELKEAL